MKRCIVFFSLYHILAASLFATGVSESSAPGGASFSSGTSLTIGLMPAVDTAPIFLAEKNGYFEEAGLDVQIQIYTNAQDRQSALQAGSLDGAMTDLVALAVNVAGGFDIRATTLTDGMFPILANPGAVEKKAVKVGLMEVSVSNFLVDQWLAEDYEVNKIFINAIPARLEALASGQTDMGLFPEPIASVGALRGLDKIIFNPPEGFSPDVMVFTGAALEGKPDAVEAFHLAFDRAVTDIRADEGAARDILIESIPNLNAELRDIITLPEYHEARLPDETYLARIIEWTEGIVGHRLNVVPADLLERRFVD